MYTADTSTRDEDFTSSKKSGKNVLDDQMKYNITNIRLKLHLMTGHCSGLVKVTPTLDDIFFGHSTWAAYFMMLRIYKHYHFNNQWNSEEENSGIQNHVSFSSYPGALSSIDDYYLLNNGLNVMETTNNMYNNTLYKFIKPQSLLTWQRLLIANGLSKNTQDWIKYFSNYNSGTYNNQWIILNTNLFQPNQPLGIYICFYTCFFCFFYCV